METKKNKQIADNYDLHLCPVCKDEIGYININLGIFDNRYFKNLNKHICSDWQDLDGVNNK